MRLPVRFSVPITVAVMALCVFAPCSGAQDSSGPGQSGQTPATGQSSSGQSSSSQSPPVQAAPQQGPVNGVYLVIDPLANVRYDNRFDASLGMAYDHMKAGPNLLQGSNLGGLDFTGSMWLTKHLAVEGSGRAYVGTSGTAPNAPNNIRGAMVKEYYFVGGPEWLGPHNKHGALIAHALVGGVYGNFQKDLLGQPPANFGFYNNQMAPAAIIGGHFDLNRSPRWVFRVTPDAIMKWYTLDYGTKITQWDVNFGISVGVEYKFKRKR